MLTKIVDGKTVQCPPEEEAAILAEWADNAAQPAPTPDPFITVSALKTALSAAGVPDQQVAAAIAAVRLAA